MILIDVRTPKEFSSGHKQGSLNIPLENILAGNLGDLTSYPKDEVIECYCLSGSRSEYAKMLLEKLGYTQVRNIGGL